MPGPIGAGETLRLSLTSSSSEVEVYPLHHGLSPPISRLSLSWSRGNCLRVSLFCQQISPPPEAAADGEVGGKVMEVMVSGGSESCFDDAQWRSIAQGAATPFETLQSRKNAVAALSNTQIPALSNIDWWDHVMEYSRDISSLLGSPKETTFRTLDSSRTILKVGEEPSSIKAAWELLEIFYVDKQSQAWLPERLVDWLADYDSVLSGAHATVHSKLLHLQNDVLYSQKVEDDPRFWQGLLSSLAVGWLDIVVRLLRLHGSYQLDQLASRETENGLVEAVAVLVSKMPRLRPELSSGRGGTSYKNKSDFIKAWEKWRIQITKLDCSSFWVQCTHQRTKDGLRNMLQIMLGNAESLTAATCNWMELFASHFLYLRPFTVGLESMYALAQKCIQLKPDSNQHSLFGLILGTLAENTEVVLSECSKAFGPWMVTHSIELLTAGSDQAEILLCEERDKLGGVSLEELHRLIYAQALASHASTWQIAPIYLASCMKQGLILLESLLYKQPAHNQCLRKSLDICRLYELEDVSSRMMKISGMYHWKHGQKGSAIYWFQQAKDEVRLNRIAQQLFDFVGKSVSNETFKQWEGLIELLGSHTGTAGGLEFLLKYRDFKKSLQQVQDGKANEAAKQAVDSLMMLMRNPSTPSRFWLPILYDSVKLLTWKERPLLNASQTNLLLSKLQEVSIAKLRPDYVEVELPPQALSSVRLALATNLGRAILED